MTEPAKPAAEQEWVVMGISTFRIYDGDRLVGTFGREEDAMRAAFAYNTLYRGSDD